MSVAVAKYLFSVEEYHQMARAGLFCEDDRIELIDGEIITMPPIGPAHSGRVKRINRALSRPLEDRAIISIRDPVRIGEQSEPEPDVMLLVPREDCYTSAHPRPKDVLLLIEVAETSLEYDRDVKIPLYARAGIREVWLLDLVNNVLHVYRRPRRNGYGSVQQFGPEDRVCPQAFPDLQIDVGQLLK